MYLVTTLFRKCQEDGGETSSSTDIFDKQMCALNLFLI